MATEAEFQDGIVKLATLYSWRVSAIESVTMRGRGGRVVRKTPAATGFPDLTFARKGVAMFWEVKTEQGTPTTEQVAWLNAISGADKLWRSRSPLPDAVVRDNLVVALVRPRHWTWIERCLANPADGCLFSLTEGANE